MTRCLCAVCKQAQPSAKKVCQAASGPFRGYALAHARRAGGRARRAVRKEEVKRWKISTVRRDSRRHDLRGRWGGWGGVGEKKTYNLGSQPLNLGPMRRRRPKAKRFQKKSSPKITRNTDAVWNPIPLGAEGTLSPSLPLQRE